ncbi:MAG: aspartate/glutamate racemase family protein [Clostridiales bacterium]|nr:aspartate/glutamate racemase family protein [Clostridiales bacterium]
MNTLGGYTFYGQDIGILMLDTVFPRTRGDIGNARTFPFPVRYKVVRDVFNGDKLPRDADEVLLNAFIKAARELEAEGCRAITTSCGFLAGFQQELAAAVNIPVFTTTLSLVPMIAPMIAKDKKIAIFTERREFMTEFLFNRAGWSSKDFQICISDLPESSAFNHLVIYDKKEGDFTAIQQNIMEMTQNHMKEHPDTGAIILECQNFAPFGSLISEISHVPVFGINQLIAFIESAIHYPDYGTTFI